MPIELSQIYQLRRGWARELYVGNLADVAASFLDSSTSMVMISRERLLHISKDHKDIDDFDILTMSYGLVHGLIIGDTGSPKCLIINYIYPDNNKRYKIAVKSANKGKELWVSTFHRLRPRQTKAHLKRGVIIKTHS